MYNSITIVLKLLHISLIVCSDDDDDFKLN